jgi:phytochelatin synthase
VTRRFGWAVLALLAVLVAYPAFLIARAKFFPKRYQVQSIALRPEYQDAALLERAWTLPVAARFGHTLESQRNISVCGLASAANVFRSLRTGPTTASSVVEDRDLVFVLDVNARYGPWLVPTERLYRAVDSVDSDVRKKRGMLLIE